MTIKKTNQVKQEVVTAGKHIYRQVLIGADESPNFAMRRFIIEPGGGMPRHTNTVEHEQYVLSGRARIGIGDKEYEVEQGDVVYIPAGTPHWYAAQGEVPFEFLCMIPNKPDQTTILES